MMDDTLNEAAVTAPDAAALVNDASEGSTFSAVRATTKLRNVMRLNAAFSVVTGVEGVIFAGWVADRLGLGSNGVLVVRLVSAGLLCFAAIVLFEAGRSAHHVLASALQIALADLVWVGATIVLVSMGIFSTSGAVVVGVLALIVLDFALLQLRHRSVALNGWTKAAGS